MATIEHRRVDLTSVFTHHFALDDIQDVFDLFSHQHDGVLKVALHPEKVRQHNRMPDAVARLRTRA